MKKLYKSTHKIVGGVLGGFAEYLKVDPTVVRLAYVGLSLITGIIPGILFYIFAVFIVPEKENLPLKADYTYTKSEVQNEAEKTKNEEPLK